MTEKDIYIIGGGPAGSATAIAIADALAMAGDSKSSRINIFQLYAADKAGHQIGETVPPAATTHLQALGMEDMLSRQEHLLCPGSISTWGDDHPGFNDFFFTPVGQGYHLDRQLFNQSLREKAQDRGVRQLADTHLVGVAQNPQGLTLQLEDARGITEQRADFVVDASGIQAALARSLGVARNQYDSVVSACAFYTLPNTARKAAHTLVGAVEVGWWYGTQLPGDRALLSFCTDAENLKQLQASQNENWFQLLLQSGWFYRQCSDQFGMQPVIPEQIIMRAAPSAILSRVIGPHWVAVGDAASSYDSMTSAGICKALEQGCEAGAAIVHSLLCGQDSALQLYQQNVFTAFNQYLKLHQQLYCSERRFSEAGFWQRRQHC